MVIVCVIVGRFMGSVASRDWFVNWGISVGWCVSWVVSVEERWSSGDGSRGDRCHCCSG